jgi:hypothetical protein
MLHDYILGIYLIGSPLVECPVGARYIVPLHIVG